MNALLALLIFAVLLLLLAQVRLFLLRLVVPRVYGATTTTPTGAGLIDGALSKQTVPYAAAITPDPTQGAHVMVGILTGPITVNNPTAGLVDGALLIFHFQQDATGTRVVTWGSAFKQSFAPTTTANLRNVVSFVYDAASGFWIQFASAIAVPA